jgi:TonB family protein
MVVCAFGAGAKSDSSIIQPKQAVDTTHTGASSVSAAPADSQPPIDTMPKLILFVKASYPPELVKRGVEGTVLLDLIVNDSGRIDSVGIVKGFNPALDSSAAKAARSFLFSPAKAGSKAVPVLMEYAYHFTVGEELTAIEEFVNFKGRLFERGTRSPLANALVVLSFPDTAEDASIKVPFRTYLKKIGGFSGQFLQENSLAATSDSLGFFQFKSIPAGAIDIKVVVPDYESFTDKEKIVHGKATDVIYRLQRLSYGANEIVVYGKVEKKEVSQQTLTLNEVKKIPGLGGDAVKVVQALPGVARSAFNMGSIIVRGSGNGDTRFFLDGVTLPVLFHFGGLISTYNSDALSSVDLYPGGFGTRYGGAMGGIVEITSRKPKTDRLHGYVDGNFFDASFMVEGPLAENVSFLVTARRSYIANMLAFVLDKVLKQTLPFTVVPYYWDFIARLDADVAKNQHCYLTMFSSEDKMEMITSAVRGGSVEVDESTNALKTKTAFQMGIAGWDWDIGKKLKNELRYSLCYFDLGLSAFGFFKVNGASYSHYFRDQLSWSSSDALKWNFGADMEITPYDLDITIPDQNNEAKQHKAHFNLGPIGAYVSADWKPTKRLELIPGVRYDYYPELDYKGSVVPELFDYHFFRNNRGISGEPSARLTSKYEIVKDHKVKASVGTYNETPQPQGQSIDTKYGDPKMPAQKGSHYVLGYEWKINDLVSMDLQGYYNRQWDLARPPSNAEIAASVMDGKEPRNYVSGGKARMTGLELMLKHDQNKRFFGWIAYSLSKSERWDFNENRWSIFGQDQTHNLQLIGSMRFRGLQEIGVRLRFVTGNPTTPLLGVDYFDATNRVYVPKYGAKNSDRMAPYVSLDVRYEKKITYKLWQWAFYIDITHVENLFGKGYRSPETSDYRWNYDYTDKQVIADITRPALGLKIDF